eukprot:3667423-Amphidinium_carterae.6
MDDASPAPPTTKKPPLPPPPTAPLAPSALDEDGYFDFIGLGMGEEEDPFGFAPLGVDESSPPPKSKKPSLPPPASPPVLDFWEPRAFPGIALHPLRHRPGWFNPWASGAIHPVTGIQSDSYCGYGWQVLISACASERFAFCRCCSHSSACLVQSIASIACTCEAVAIADAVLLYYIVLKVAALRPLPIMASCSFVV